MKLIASADKNWGIGCKNKLLVSIPSDMKFFKNTTTGKVIVMGRKTLESFPGAVPLSNRTNIVFTSNEQFRAKGAVIVHGLESLEEELKKYNTEDVYVIGGASIYKQLLPLCDTAYITKIDRIFQADTYLPNLDKDKEWEMVQSGEEQTCFNLEYRFTTYKRIKNIKNQPLTK